MVVFMLNNSSCKTNEGFGMRLKMLIQVLKCYLLWTLHLPLFLGILRHPSL